MSARVGGSGKRDFVSHVGPPEELLTLAARADVIVSAVPLTPETTVPEIPPSPESSVALEIVKLLREYIFPTTAGKMMDAMTKTMEEMTNVTHLKYRQVCYF